MNYAVIRTGGKQYKVTEGEILSVERLDVKPNDSITFSDVLMVASDGDVKFGQPLIDGMIVTAKVLEHTRGEKIRVAKYKAKVRYRRVTGHRQELSKVQIESIGKTKAVKAETKEETPQPETKKTTPRRTVKK